MSDIPPRRERPQPEIDISTPGKAPQVGWRGATIVWVVFLVSLLLVFFLDLPIWSVAIGIAVGGSVGLVEWLVRVQMIRRGTLTWMRLARAPAKAMARGDAVGADAAYVKALARARRFAAGDSRRAVMLGELATYAKNQGRLAEAFALRQENVAILARHLHDCPLDYFVALNNLAIHHIHLKEYDAAQAIFEGVFDLIVAAKKNESEGGLVLPDRFLQPIQVLIHLNVAFLMIEMRAWPEAEEQLGAAAELLPLLPRQARTRYHDHFVGSCALLDYESGQFADAEEEIANASNRDYYVCLRVRAGLHRVRGEFAEAERLLHRHQAESRKRGALHRPEMLKPTLEFAECLFGQGKSDAAFASLDEARGLVADFKLPPDAFWRKTLATWLQRARDSARAELVESLERELANLPATTEQAITILAKLRISATPS